MSVKKPRPLVVPPKHERCPVCGEVSYSIAGVHPQCAVRQADEERMSRIKREKQTERRIRSGRGAGARPRICPECKTVQEVQMKVCQCGHTFTVPAGHTTSEGDPS